LAFNSLEFVLFLVIVLAAHAWLARYDRSGARKGLLLVASYFFYMAWSPPFILLLMGSTLLDYGVGIALDHKRSPAARRGLLALSVAGNLGVLGFFKYGRFFGENLAWLAGSSGFDQSPLLDMVLPVGISFYTFQSLSYSIDVYRGALRPTRSFVDLALYVAFFPQLVAGPIVRATNFLPQLKQMPEVRAADVEEGLARIAGGFVKKVVLADSLARYCDSVFGNLDAYGGLNLWLASVAYAYQIYFDFSGYSDIAIGTARLFGFRIPENFDRPYLATNPRDFWRRWHISLSTWLRDYLYISLGGNRKGRGRALTNLFITMLLGGLWHGAAWHFVVWGAFHGLWLTLHRLVADARGEREPRSPVWFRRMATFGAVCFGWLIFRLSGLGEVMSVLGRMTSPDSVLDYRSTASATVAALVIAIAIVLHWSPPAERLRAWLLGRPPALIGVAYAVAVLLVFFFSPATAQFIYFQF